MPLPLFWIGAGIAAAYAGNELVKNHYKSANIIGNYPGEDAAAVAPVDGAVMCCGIFGVFDHTGIWVNGDIIELKGNGLIRGISPDRFVGDRTGESIYVACDENGVALGNDHAAEHAISKLFNVEDYHVIYNNCHKFVWQCVAGENTELTRFAELNEKLSQYYGCAIHWHPAAVF